jgi:HK97 family phage prohead protease
MSHASKPPGERRVSPATLRVERRAEGDGDGPGAPPARIVGHASVFDQWTTLYEGRYWTWREVVRPGAFANAIKEGQDVRCLFNHDSNFILGRTRSGTCRISEDARGLLSDTTPPDTQTVRDLVLTPIERGDVDGMSFAFSVRKADAVTKTEDKDGTVRIDSGGERVTLRYEGERLVEEREVLDADLYDVSPVVYPAYSGTDVALRALGPDVERRAREMDVPHARPAPKREQLRQWLAESDARPAGPSQGSAAPGR